MIFLAFTIGTKDLGPVNCGAEGCCEEEVSGGRDSHAGHVLFYPPNGKLRSRSDVRTQQKGELGKS